MKIAIIAGATGLIGSQLLDLLLEDTYYSKVIAVTRKPITKSSARFENVVINFDKMQEYTSQLKADDVFCCLGTTIKQAGSKEAFRKVDLSYPVSLATITKSMGAQHFYLVTALGSNEKSSIFYNRVKGEVERMISEIGFESLHVFRPSMLLGPRIDERAGENVGQGVMKVLDFVIPKKYKAIESIRVARAMLSISKAPGTGSFFHESGELQSF
ncbi:MAG: oxidoreductase [Cyclobacteriaceae bacterium]|nr:oxidoreductase [Cyclobacteriaceae bacterium]